MEQTENTQQDDRAKLTISVIKLNAKILETPQLKGRDQLPVTEQDGIH